MPELLSDHLHEMETPLLRVDHPGVLSDRLVGALGQGEPRN